MGGTALGAPGMTGAGWAFFHLVGSFARFLGLTWDAVRGSVRLWKKSCIPRGPPPPRPIRHFVPRI